MLCADGGSLTKVEFFSWNETFVVKDELLLHQNVQFCEAVVVCLEMVIIIQLNYIYMGFKSRDI